MTYGAVASGSQYTTDAGVQILERGGNAIDALIASQLCACVCEPLLTGLAGAGIGTVRFNGETFVVDMFSTMPGQLSGLAGEPSKTIGEKITLDFGDTTQSFVVGTSTVATPTLPIGLFMLYERFASLPLIDLIEPALKCSKNGFVVSASLEYLIELLAPIIHRSEEMSQWFFPKGKRLREGDTCHISQMTEDLLAFERLGHEFWLSERYKGLFTLHNSLLVKNNIQNYRASITKLNPINCDRNLVWTPNFPSVGGEIIRSYFENLQTTGPLNVRFEDILMAKSLAEAKCQYHLDNMVGNTTHISVIDRNGNIGALTTSLGETAGVVIPKTGIILNNFLGEADVAHPSLLNFPDSRLLTMCAPTLLDTPNATYVLGSGGSSRIPSAIIQVMEQLNSGTTLEAAIDAGRFHIQYTNESENLRRLNIERTGLGRYSKEELQSANEINIFDEVNMYFGGVHGVAMLDGKFIAHGDSRRSGSSKVVEREPNRI